VKLPKFSCCPIIDIWFCGSRYIYIYIYICVCVCVCVCVCISVWFCVCMFVCVRLILLVHLYNFQTWLQQSSRTQYKLWIIINIHNNSVSNCTQHRSSSGANSVSEFRAFFRRRSSTLRLQYEETHYSNRQMYRFRGCRMHYGQMLFKMEYTAYTRSF